MYSCNTCAKNFTWPDSLTRHKRIKHHNALNDNIDMHNRNVQDGGTDGNRDVTITNKIGYDGVRELTEDIVYIDPTFTSPTTLAISGTTGSGKTSLMFKIIQHKDELFSTPPKKIMYCYGVWQSIFDEMEENLGIIFQNGLPSESVIDKFVDGNHNVIILDDLMDQVVQNANVQNLFTRGSHHKNLTIIYINQNMFCQGKCARTMNLNTHYMILLRNPRDVSQVSVLGKQTGLGKQLVEAYQDALSKPYGYLVVDLSPHSSDFKLKTNILPDEYTIVYVPL